MHSRMYIFSLLFIPLFFMGCAPELRLNKVTTLSNYPSGSGIVYINNKLFVIGDDVNYLLIADTAFNITGSIRLYDSLDKRIPKPLKQDLEAAAVVTIGSSQKILLTGSGSLSPYRNAGWLVDPSGKENIPLNLDVFYKRLKAEGMDALNIEGLTEIPRGMVLASRGNRSFRINFLIFTDREFWKNQDSANIKIMKVGTNTDTASFSGVSGLEYSKASDRLLLTVSTENTSSVLEDGTIGKSYLWIIDYISAKKRMMAINPNRVIDLEAADERFKGHKIESVCIIGENRKSMEVVLVADDDNGTSTLFNVTIKK